MSSIVSGRCERSDATVCSCARCLSVRKAFIPGCVAVKARDFPGYGDLRAGLMDVVMRYIEAAPAWPPGVPTSVPFVQRVAKTCFTRPEVMMLATTSPSSRASSAPTKAPTSMLSPKPLPVMLADPTIPRSSSAITIFM